MKRFNDLKIGVRILTGFLITVIIAGIIGGVGVLNLQRLNKAYHAAYSDSTSLLAYSERISSSFQRIRMNLYGYVLADTPQDKQFFLDRIDEFKTIIDENIENYRKVFSVYSPEEVADELELVDALQESLTAFGTKRNELIEGVGAKPALRSEAFEQLKDGGELSILAAAVDESIIAIIDHNNGYVKEQIQNNNRMASISTIIIAAVLAGGIVLAVIIGVYISRGISRRIGKLVTVADKIASGDVNIHVEAYSKDEIGVLAHHFGNMADILKTIINDLTRGLEAFAEGNFDLDSQAQDSYVGNFAPLLAAIRKTRDNLSSTLRQINTAAEQVATGSDQVSSGAQALAAGSTEQAASVEELAASVDTIAKQAKENLEAITSAGSSVGQADAGVNVGNERMGQLSQAMSDISTASNQIANITKVIEDIAFQTNILALNAAIEAARAGSAGKGFAVVADEVRNLAAKSAKAAKQTSTLIQSSVAAVEKGADITNQTAQILQNVGTSAAEVKDNFGKIEKSISDQTAAIEQIKGGLSQISSVVQTNAATAEENSATSEEMSAQAVTLREAVGKFKLSDRAAQENASPAAAPVKQELENHLSESSFGLEKY